MNLNNLTQRKGSIQQDVLNMEGQTEPCEHQTANQTVVSFFPYRINEQNTSEWIFPCTPILKLQFYSAEEKPSLLGFHHMHFCARTQLKSDLYH